MQNHFIISITGSEMRDNIHLNHGLSNLETDYTDFRSQKRNNNEIENKLFHSAEFIVVCFGKRTNDNR